MRELLCSSARHGVIQGYNGIATVDEKHQVIVDAQAFGEGHEAQHVPEVLDSIERQFKRLDEELNIYDEIVLTADSGYNSEASAKTVLDRGIDAYFADTQFRKRDPRFANQQEHRARAWTAGEPPGRASTSPPPTFISTKRAPSSVRTGRR
ncbi:MAG: transposase [Spirochaetales bacterium]